MHAAGVVDHAASVRNAPGEAGNQVVGSAVPVVVGVDLAFRSDAIEVGGDDARNRRAVHGPHGLAALRRAVQVRVRPGHDVTHAEVDDTYADAFAGDAGVQKVRDAELAEIPRLRGVIGRDV